MEYTFHYIYEDHIHKGNKFFICNASVDTMPNYYSTILTMHHDASAKAPLWDLHDFINTQRNSICGSPVLFEKSSYPFAGRGRLYNDKGTIEIRLENLLMLSYTGGLAPITVWSIYDINFVWNP
jgi:hypothetical protein